MPWVSHQQLIRDFALPARLARDIIATQWQQAYRRHWQPWAWLLPWWLAAGRTWLHGPSWHLDSILLLIAGAIGWQLIGRGLAVSAILDAARAKAARLYPDGMPTVSHAGTEPRR